jgi:hypothetical protein
VSQRADRNELLRGVFRREAETILRRFGDASMFQHRGEAGADLEGALRRFLAEFLPKRWGVGTGEIAASNGDRSAQHDVIVYDAIATPVIHRSESGGIIVPVEGVHAVVEVARQLDGRKLTQDATKIATLKALPRRDFCFSEDRSLRLATFGSDQSAWPTPIRAFCFGLDGASVDTLRETLVECDRRVPNPRVDDPPGDFRSFDAFAAADRRVDTVVSLTKGLICNGVQDDGRTLLSAHVTRSSERVALPSSDEFSTANVFGLFVQFIEEELAKADTGPVSLNMYR